MTNSLALLVSQWHDEANTLRKRGADVQAVAVESCADELACALQDRANELLNLTEAARLSGYSGEHLGRWSEMARFPTLGVPMRRASDMAIYPARLACLHTASRCTLRTPAGRRSHGPSCKEAKHDDHCQTLELLYRRAWT